PPTQAATQSALRGSQNASVRDLSAAGTALQFSTYLGGGSSDQGNAIAVTSGMVYVAGTTSSTNFPTAGTPYQSTFGGGTSNVFLARYAPTGSLQYSTYLGGSGTDTGYAVAAINPSKVTVVGQTSSTNFPTLSPLAGGSSLSGLTDAFVSQLDTVGGGLVYSTYLGGSSDDAARGVAMDPVGNAYVAGWTTSTNF